MEAANNQIESPNEIRWEDTQRELEKPSVLMVDDRPENLMALHAILDNPDYAITDCKSGIEALKCLMEKNYDLILLDIQMPEMDGFETAQLIKSRPRCKNIPLIFITAKYLDEPSVMRGYGLGAADYITKPLLPAALKKKVEFFLSYGKSAGLLRHEMDKKEGKEQFERLSFELNTLLTSAILNVQLLEKYLNDDRMKFLKKVKEKLALLDSSLLKMALTLRNFQKTGQLCA